VPSFTPAVPSPDRRPSGELDGPAGAALDIGEADCDRPLRHRRRVAGSCPGHGRRRSSRRCSRYARPPAISQKKGPPFLGGAGHGRGTDAPHGPGCGWSTTPTRPCPLDPPCFSRRQSEPKFVVKAALLGIGQDVHGPARSLEPGPPHACRPHSGRVVLARQACGRRTDLFLGGRPRARQQFVESLVFGTICFYA